LPATGALFEGTSRFAVSRKLGEGGMGVVYEAYDRDRNIAVALKTLLNLSPNALLLFKQEFRSVAGIVHPNLISLYELFAEGEVWFFTMELLKGRHLIETLRSGCSNCEFSKPTEPPRGPTANLLSIATSAAPMIRKSSANNDYYSLDRLDRREPMVRGTAPDPAALRDAMLQVARGLVAVHSAGKLHRDIKPSNIMLTTEGRAVVLDFGLAQELDFTDDPRNHTIAGTVAYMPPEQSVTRSLTPAADWYALGVTLYQSLTGVLPFGGGTMAMHEAKRRRVVIAPSQLVIGADAELEALTLELLHPDPLQRPKGEEIVSRLAGGPAAIPRSFRSAVTAQSPQDRHALFVGRTAEIEMLQAAFECLCAGETVFATVHGISGVGKTALVDHFLQLALDKSMILRGRCYEQESVPYKAVDSAMDALCQQLLRLSRDWLASLLPDNMAMLAKLFPVLRQLQQDSSWTEPTAAVSDPRHARRLAIAALRDLLRRLAQRRRIVLVIDDLQWGDTDSATLLAELLAAPDPPPMLVLCTYRREYADRSACLQTLLPTLRENPALNRIDLPVEPLTAGEARDFATQLMGESHAGAISQIVADSGGSPYLVKELADYVATRPRESSTGVSLEQALAQRFFSLAPDAQQLLEVIAVHGLPLAQIDAYRAANLAGRDPAPLATLRYANLIRSTGTAETDEVEPYHDRVRETVVARLAVETKRERHNALATTLEESGRADAETLASHYQGAGDNQRAGELFEVAADHAAATLAFDRAASFYQRSLQLRVLSTAAEFGLRQRLAEALANARGGVEAAEAFEGAARLADPAQQLGLERRAAFYYMSSGRVEQGRAVLERVMKRVGVWLPQTRAGVLALLAARTLRLALQSLNFRERPEDKISGQVRDRFDAAYAMAAPMGMIDGAQGLSFGALCLRLALRAGDPVRMAYGLQVGGYGMTLQGPRGRRRAAKVLDTARRISVQRGDPKLDATVAFSAGSQVYVVGQWHRALECFAEAEHLYSKCPGTHWELASLRILRLYTLFSLGEFSAMAKEYGPILEDARALDDQYSCASVETFCQPIALLAADRVTDAREAVNAGLARWKVEQHGLQQVMAAQSLNAAGFYDGTAGSMMGFMQDQWRLLRSSGMASFDNLRISWLERMARTGLAAAGAANATAEDRRAGLRMAHNALRQLKKQTLPWSHAVTSPVEAGLLAIEGDRDGATRLLLKATEQFSQVEMRGNEASCRLYAGVLIGGERGAEMEQAARHWFASQNIVNAYKMAAVHVGGTLPANIVRC
jgi:serine/threonine protein kinase